MQADAVSVFEDEFALTREDPDAEGEQRFVTMGADAAGHLLVVGGRAFVGSLINAKDKAAVADRWARNKAFYPYFTEFVYDMLYMAYYAMTKPNAPIDLNAQADLNVMAHLLHAEVLVCNEKGFLRTAFEELWKPRGKVLMTGPEFLQYLGKF